jgi:hypothetical protein
MDGARFGALQYARMSPKLAKSSHTAESKHWAPAQLRGRECPALIEKDRAQISRRAEVPREGRAGVLVYREFSLALAIHTQFEFDSSGEALQKLATTLLPNLGNATPIIHLQKTKYVRTTITA